MTISPGVFGIRFSIATLFAYLSKSVWLTMKQDDEPINDLAENMRGHTEGDLGGDTDLVVSVVQWRGDAFFKESLNGPIERRRRGLTGGRGRRRGAGRVWKGWNATIFIPIDSQD